MQIRGEVIILLLICGFCDGFVDLLVGLGQAYGGGTNLDQINPYGNILGDVNPNALAAHQLRHLHLQRAGTFGNILGPVNINAIKAHQLQQNAGFLAAQLQNARGLYVQGQPQSPLLNLPQPKQLGIQIVGQGQGQGQGQLLQGQGQLLRGQGHGLGVSRAQLALLQRQLLRGTRGRFQGQGLGRRQGQSQGQIGQPGLNAQSLIRYLGLLAQGQGQLPNDQGQRFNDEGQSEDQGQSSKDQDQGQVQGRQGEEVHSKGQGYLTLLQSQKQGNDFQDQPKNLLEFLIQSQDPDQDIQELLGDSDYESYDDDTQTVVQNDDYEEEDDDYEEPTYATNAQGEVVTINDAKSTPRGKDAKIGGLTSLIGGHLSSLGDHFTGHDVELHEIGGHGGHSGGYGGHGGGHGGGYGDHGHTVKLVIDKSKGKKKKIISTFHGFYIPGGTAMFGKFKDVKACQKACSITATCFAGDFDPWLGKCFIHTNVTACMSLRAHPSVTHFSKVPCNLVDTTRGLITLGTQIFSGLEQLGVKDLKTCLKRCATAGGGIAATTAEISTTPQLCFGIDYDFATHKCFFHVDPDLCPAVDPIPTPVTLSPMMSSVNILLCPLEA